MPVFIGNKIICSMCNGTGYLGHCEKCHGTGLVKYTNEEWFCRLPTKEKAKEMLLDAIEQYLLENMTDTKTLPQKEN